jgi:acyl carrier protein
MQMINNEVVINLINKSLNLQFDPKNTPTDVSFKSLGIDSLDMFSVLVDLEALTGRDLPDSEVENLVTIDDLVRYFS